MSKKIMLGGNIFGYATSFNETKKLLNFCYSKNIRAIDTADVYSDGVSEKFIGKIIKSNRHNWYLATKCGVKSNHKTDYINSKKSLNKKIESSLKRLKTDYINLYQLHHFDIKTNIDETFGALEDLKKQGKILNYGISNFNTKQFKQVSSYYKIFSHQINYNILNNDIYERFKNIINRPIYIAYNVLNRGLLRNELILEKNFKTFRSNKSKSVMNDTKTKILYKYLEKLYSFSKKNEISIQQLAYKYVLDNKNVKYLILGIRTIDQIKEFISFKKKINWEKLTYSLKNIKKNDKEKFGPETFL